MPTLELSRREGHLWEAANILRGPVDAADFKTYVFPLLFFKRISDVFDEEYAAALAESGGDEEYALFPQNYRFQIPKGCHWSDVRVVTTNVGIARVVTLDEIAANDHNLNISRYVEPKSEEEVLTDAEAMKRLRESVKAAATAEDRFVAILKREGLLL